MGGAMKPRTRLRGLRRIVAVAALALIIVGLWGTPAFAHAVLQGTAPSSGATVKRSPAAVTLTFNERVEAAALGGIRVFDSRAQRVDVGSPTHSDGGRKVRAPLPDLKDGTYVVTWRVVSADGHPVRGAFTFSVGSTSTTSKQAQGLAQRLLTDQGGDAAVGILFAIMRFGAFAGLAVLIGGAAFLAWVWRAGRGEKRARTIVWTAWGTALGATLLGYALQGPYAAALSVTKVVDPSLWSEVWDTRLGKVYLARVLLLLLVIPLLRMLLPKHGPVIEHPLPSWWSVAGAFLAIGLSATPGLAGHASSGPLIPLAISADTWHVLGVCAWLGGLVLLFGGLMPRADEPTLRATVPRYSKYALVAVSIIVVTGVFQAFRQVNRLGALLDTDYGRLLLIKIIVFLGLMVVAAVSRDITNRRWRIPTDVLDAPDAPVPVGALAGATGAGPTTEVPDWAKNAGMAGDFGGDDGDEPEYPEGYILDEPTAERRLRRSLFVEVLISVVILAVTALLVNAAPARELDTGPYLATLNTKQVSFDVTITPANRGANEMHLFTLSPRGTVTDPTEVSAALSQSENNIGPIDVKLIRLGPGHYTSAGFDVPFAGDWQLTVKAVLGDVNEVSTSATVPIHS